MNRTKFLNWRGAALIVAFFAIFSALNIACAASPYKEAPGAKDHPMVGRFQGAMLYKHGVINFERVEVKLPDGRAEAAEGRVYNYYYLGPKDRSDLEVFRNYKNALEQQRFKIVFACEDVTICHKHNLDANAGKWTADSRTFAGGSYYMNNLTGGKPFRFLLARLSRAEGDVMAVLTIRGGYFADQGFGTDYFLQVVESMPMQANQVAVNADVMNKGLNAEGKVSLYGIYFDTGKAEIKPESKPQLEEMHKLLSQNPALKVFIVGHTDNQGTLEGNIALSQKRAEAIVTALARDYKVSASRLAAKGVASYAPVASNGAEAGRAKNRRVELVVQ